MARYAAVDIGSNSVRMEAAEVTPGAAPDGPPRILASERQVTRLGESVFRTGRISPESIALVCGVLSNMAAIYKRLDVSTVRAVATAAVRDASNGELFAGRVREDYDLDAHVLSGEEEAQLSFAGATARRVDQESTPPTWMIQRFSSGSRP